MNRNAIEKIMLKAKFLQEKGYDVVIKNNRIIYSRDDTSFIVTFEPYDDISNILIKFNRENISFDIGWIALVRSGLSIEPHNMLENVQCLLEYISVTWENILDIDYCRESQKLVSEYVAQEGVAGN